MAANTNYSGPVTSAVMKKEDAFGTAETTGFTSMGIYATSIDVDISVDTTRVNAVGVRESQALVGTLANVTGTIEGHFQDARLIAFAMGNDYTSGTGPYTHRINYKTIAATPLEISALPSFTMVVTRGTDVAASYSTVETYAGCRITNLRLRGDLNAPMTLTADFVAKNVSVQTITGAQVASYSADEVHPPQYMSLYIPASAGTALAQVQSFDLTINNNLERVNALGSQLLQASPAKQIEIDLNGTVAMTDEAVLFIADLTNDASPYTFTAGTTAPKATETIKIVSTNGLATTNERSLTINIGAAAITKQSVSTKVGDVTMLDFTATVRDFLHTNWNATPTGAPIVFVDNTTVSIPAGYIGTPV